LLSLGLFGMFVDFLLLFFDIFQTFHSSL
jgi:hypothetical protein